MLASTSLSTRSVGGFSHVSATAVGSSAAGSAASAAPGATSRSRLASFSIIGAVGALAGLSANVPHASGADARSCANPSVSGVDVARVSDAASLRAFPAAFLASLFLESFLLAFFGMVFEFAKEGASGGVAA